MCCFIAGYHRAREVLALDHRHDHYCDHMYCNHDEERPAHDLVKIFGRLAAECAGPYGRRSQCKEDHHGDGAKWIVAEVRLSATVKQARQVSGDT